MTLLLHLAKASHVSQVSIVLYWKLKNKQQPAPLPQALGWVATCVDR